MLVCYIGKKTAYYRNERGDMQSYFPGEVFEAPDQIPKRDTHGNHLKDDAGNAICQPLVLGPYSKLRPATEDELKQYVDKNPRYKRRQETVASQEAAARRKPKHKGGLSAGT